MFRSVSKLSSYILKSACEPPGSNHISLLRLSMESFSKKTKYDLLKIGTHNGTFHCDEVFACFMLKQLPQYKHAQIIRTRDPSKLADCDIVVDVGGVYDPKSHRYDHHQRSFNESLSTVVLGKKWQTKLSSAGLVYAHFGKDVLKEIMELKDQSEDEDMISILYDKIYETFVEAVDAIDNGINVSQDNPRYAINTDVSSRVAHLNPSWNDPNAQKEEFAYERFLKAFNMVGEEFTERVKFFRDVWWPARLVVKEAMDKRFEVDGSGEIIVFERSCPWKDHLLMLEDEMIEKGKKEPLLKYVLYTDANNTWMVQCVPVHKNSFENRLSLPESWRGLRDEELSQKCGIKDCVFVHASGFVGGNKTKEGALTMARESLKNAKNKSPCDMAEHAQC